MQIKELINEEKSRLIKNNIEDAGTISKLLMTYLLKEPQSYIVINGDKELEDLKVKEYISYIDKVIKGTPIQYITNNQEFMKLNFYVDENVLIPQPDTEILVESVIEECKNKQYKTKSLEILDLCTGSGAIGVSLAKYIENSKVTCSDISMKALQIAKLNAEKNLVHRDMEFILSDLFEEMNKRKFDIIASNPPYIKTNVIKSLSKAVQNEPHLALDGGDDGLDFYRIIVAEAYSHLEDGGKLFLEIGFDQKDDVINLLQAQNEYEDIKCLQDLSGNDRVIIAKGKSNK